MIFLCDAHLACRENLSEKFVDLTVQGCHIYQYALKCISFDFQVGEVVGASEADIEKKVNEKK